jgi:hypothetical protein
VLFLGYRLSFLSMQQPNSGKPERIPTGSARPGILNQADI